MHVQNMMRMKKCKKGTLNGKTQWYQQQNQHQSNARKYHLALVSFFSQSRFFFFSFALPFSIYFNRDRFSMLLLLVLYFTFLFHFYSRFFLSYIHSLYFFRCLSLWNAVFFLLSLFFLSNAPLCACILDAIHQAEHRCSLCFSSNTKHFPIPLNSGLEFSCVKMRDSCGNKFSPDFLYGYDFYFQNEKWFCDTKTDTQHSVSPWSWTSVHGIIHTYNLFAVLFQFNWSFDKSPIVEIFALSIHNIV